MFLLRTQHLLLLRAEVINNHIPVSDIQRLFFSVIIVKARKMYKINSRSNPRIDISPISISLTSLNSHNYLSAWHDLLSFHHIIKLLTILRIQFILKCSVVIPYTDTRCKNSRKLCSWVPNIYCVFSAGGMFVCIRKHHLPRNFNTLLR